MTKLSARRIAASMLLLLAGCASNQQQALESPATYCRRLGHTLGTNPFIQCMQIEHENRRVSMQALEQNRRSALARLDNWYAMSAQRQSQDFRTQMEAITAIGRNQQLQTTPPAIPYPPRPLSCTTNYVGGAAFTNCY